jgi:SAM-dependent methyltransferase
MKLVLRKRHICLREFMKIVVPGRWQDAPIWESLSALYGHPRLYLPEFAIEVLFPGIESLPVQVSLLPQGSWSAPVVDQVMLAKFARWIKPKHVLEVGSFRGYTARLLAENTPDDCAIHTLDIAPDHGQAYQGEPIAAKILRHIGSLQSSPSALPAGQKYDFIFLDADHQRSAVESDTRHLLPLLSKDGILFWHDYADWGWMSEWNGVPEYLCELERTLPILSVPGTTLAVYRPAWSKERVEEAIDRWKGETKRDLPGGRG